jgi:hypothetical protein
VLRGDGWLIIDIRRLRKTTLRLIIGFPPLAKPMIV